MMLPNKKIEFSAQATVYLRESYSLQVWVSNDNNYKGKGKVQPSDYDRWEAEEETDRESLQDEEEGNLMEGIKQSKQSMMSRIGESSRQDEQTRLNNYRNDSNFRRFVEKKELSFDELVISFLDFFYRRYILKKVLPQNNPTDQIEWKAQPLGQTSDLENSNPSGQGGSNQITYFPAQAPQAPDFQNNYFSIFFIMIKKA
jgi:hypothetical protein